LALEPRGVDRDGAATRLPDGALCGRAAAHGLDPTDGRVVPHRRTQSLIDHPVTFPVEGGVDHESDRVDWALSVEP